ncbi:hypothetical protein EMST110833_08495 [Empedobacter stercoris]
MTKFEYQSALITDASSGIGKSFAYLLASKGVNLVLSARSEDKLLQISEELKAEFKINVVCIRTDLSEINP